MTGSWGEIVPEGTSKSIEILDTRTGDVARHAISAHGEQQESEDGTRQRHGSEDAEQLH